MLRKCAWSAADALLISCTANSVATTLKTSNRAYRIIPHVHYEIEELAETEAAGRWYVTNKDRLQQPMKLAEWMIEKLNWREKRRSGVLPEKSIARRISQQYAVEGKVYESSSTTKIINFTVLGFDGHPFHFRTYPRPELTLNMFIEESGMNFGEGENWVPCHNYKCKGIYHSEGCLVNVDLETLDNLPCPTRAELKSMDMWRNDERADIQFNTRFSCQIDITEDIDGGVFALKQVHSAGLRAATSDWGAFEDFGVVQSARCKPIQPWAPIIEEPTKIDFPITPDMIWMSGYQEVMERKYPNWRRKDGFHTKPEDWGANV